MNWELKRIKSVLAILILLLGYQMVSAQIAPEKYWIQFTDKANSPYSISNPLLYLSQRAINRRNAQGISITEQDFPVNSTYVQGVQQTASVNVLIQSKWLNGVVIQTTDTVGLAQILALPFVDASNSRNVAGTDKGQKSHKMDISGSIVENEMPSSSAEGLDYGLATTQNTMLSVDYLHDLGFTGAGMVIAVLDAGFIGADTTDILQPLFTNNQIIGTWDFVLGQPLDFSSHSSHGKYVLNCMGANVPGKYIGTAPDASYWLLRTEDAPTENPIEEYNWVAGAEFADSAGADVFNTSLGYTTFDDSLQSYTYADMDGNTAVITKGADIAASKGILVVNSAGNSGNNSWYYIGAPADGDSVLTIGAVGFDSVITGFSSRGPSADGRLKPNVMAQGGGVPMPWGHDSTFFINGTSFSGPILAGAAACLWQSRPLASNMEIYQAIEQSAHLNAAPNNDYGNGIPNLGLAYYSITSVNEAHGFEYLDGVYPNPTKGMVYVKAVENLNYLRVLNYSGRVIKYISEPTVSNGFVELSLDFLPAGIYFIETTFNQLHTITKVVKN